MNDRFGAAVKVMLSGLPVGTLLWLAAVYPAPTLLDDYLIYHLLPGLAEACFSGALITVMVVHAPRWVGSVDDRRDLLNK